MPKTRQSKRSSSNSSHDSSSSSEGSTSPYYGENLRRSRDRAEEDLSDLQRQFTYLFELRFHEKMKRLAEKEKIVIDGNCTELLRGVQRLEEVMNERIDKAELLRDARLKSCNMKFEAEQLTIQNTFKEEKKRLKESYVSSIREQIRALEDSFDDDFLTRVRLQSIGRQPKVVQKTVETLLQTKEVNQEEDNDSSKTDTWPNIIYQLKESEVLEDLAVTKQALARKARLDRIKRNKAAKRLQR